MINSPDKVIKQKKTDINLDNIGVISIDEEWSQYQNKGGSNQEPKDKEDKGGPPIKNEDLQNKQVINENKSNKQFPSLKQPNLQIDEISQFQTCENNKSLQSSENQISQALTSQQPITGMIDPKKLYETNPQLYSQLIQILSQISSLQQNVPTQSTPEKQQNSNQQINNKSPQKETNCIVETKCEKKPEENKDIGMSLLQNNKLQEITSKLKTTTSKEFFQESSPIQNLSDNQYLVNTINTSNQKPEGLLEIDQEVNVSPNCSVKLEKKIQLKLQEDTSNNSLNQDSDPLIQLKQKFGKDRHKTEQKGSHLPQAIIQNMVESQEKVFERKMKKSKQIQKLLVDQFSAIQKSKDKKPISFTQQQLMNLAQTPQSCSSKSFFQSCKTSIDDRIKQDQFTSPQHHRPQTNTQPSQIASQNKGLLKKLIQNASSFLSSPNAKLSQTTTQRVSKMMQNTKQLKDLQNYISNSNISSLLKDICSQSMATTGSKTFKNCSSNKKSNSIEKEIIQSITVDKSSKSVTRKKSKSRRKKTQIKNCQINNINKSQNQNYLLQYFQE